LKLLIDNKNEALQKCLQRDNRSCKRFFRQCQRVVQKAVTKAKIQKVASDAEAAFKDGKAGMCPGFEQWGLHQAKNSV